MAQGKSDRTVQFIAKLVRLTQDGELEWRSASLPREARDTSDEAAFLADLEGRQLRLYRDKREMMSIGVVFGDDWTKPKLTLVPVLEILDDHGRSVYSFAHTTGLADLYEAVAFSASGVGKLMDSVLKQ